MTPNVHTSPAYTNPSLISEQDALARCNEHIQNGLQQIHGLSSIYVKIGQQLIWVQSQKLFRAAGYDDFWAWVFAQHGLKNTQAKKYIRVACAFSHTALPPGDISLDCLYEIALAPMALREGLCALAEAEKNPRLLRQRRLLGESILEKGASPKAAELALPKVPLKPLMHLAGSLKQMDKWTARLEQAAKSEPNQDPEELKEMIAALEERTERLRALLPKDQVRILTPEPIAKKPPEAEIQKDEPKKDEPKKEPVRILTRKGRSAALFAVAFDDMQALLQVSIRDLRSFTARQPDADPGARHTLATKLIETLSAILALPPEQCGPDSQERAETLLRLGHAYLLSGDVAGVERCAKEVLAIYARSPESAFDLDDEESYLFEDPPIGVVSPKMRAQAMSQLAYVAQKRGEKNALALFEQAHRAYDMTESSPDYGVYQHLWEFSQACQAHGQNQRAAGLLSRLEDLVGSHDPNEEQPDFFFTGLAIY